MVGSTPKQPPNVAIYIIGTHGFVPNTTLCAPIKPNGKGNANNADTAFLFLISFFDNTEVDTNESFNSKATFAIKESVFFMGKLFIKTGVVFTISNEFADIEEL